MGHPDRQFQRFVHGDHVATEQSPANKGEWREAGSGLMRSLPGVVHQARINCLGSKGAAQEKSDTRARSQRLKEPASPKAVRKKRMETRHLERAAPSLAQVPGPGPTAVICRRGRRGVAGRARVETRRVHQSQAAKTFRATERQPGDELGRQRKRQNVDRTHTR